MNPIEFCFAEDGTPLVRSSFDKPLNLTPEENIALDIVFDTLKDIASENAELHAERRSDNYLSIVAFEHHDFMRIKIGDRSKWFTVALSPSDRIDLAQDARFAKVKNKNQLHWKVSLSAVEGLKQHSDLIQKAYLAAKWSHEKFCT